VSGASDGPRLRCRLVARAARVTTTPSRSCKRNHCASPRRCWVSCGAVHTRSESARRSTGAPCAGGSIRDPGASTSTQRSRAWISRATRGFVRGWRAPYGTPGGDGCARRCRPRNVRGNGPRCGPYSWPHARGYQGTWHHGSDLHFNDVHLTGTVKNGRFEISELVADGQEIVVRGEGNVLMRDPSRPASSVSISSSHRPRVHPTVSSSPSTCSGTSGEGGARRIGIVGTMVARPCASRLLKKPICVVARALACLPRQRVRRSY